MIDKPSLGFPGAGRGTRPMLEGLFRANAFPARAAVGDMNEERARETAAAAPGVEVSDAIGVAAADIVVIAVPPPAVPAALSEIADAARPESIVLSLAPKHRFADRALPARVFRPLGAMPEVEETSLEACAVISAMGPTYLWFRLDLPRKPGEEFGSTPDAARSAAAAMAHGSVASLLESDLPADFVMDLVSGRPMAENQPLIAETYRSRLRAVYAKLTARRLQPDRPPHDHARSHPGRAFRLVGSHPVPHGGPPPATRGIVRVRVDPRARHSPTQGLQTLGRLAGVGTGADAAGRAMGAPHPQPGSRSGSRRGVAGDPDRRDRRSRTRRRSRALRAFTRPVAALSRGLIRRTSLSEGSPRVRVVHRAPAHLAASTLGAITPFCSCSSVPLFIAFLKAGIPLGVATAFPVTSPPSSTSWRR